MIVGFQLDVLASECRTQLRQPFHPPRAGRVERREIQAKRTMPSLSESYEFCRKLTRRTAHNFRFSFLTLPEEKRRAMEALYAFNRITDDLGDDTGMTLQLRKVRLGTWRQAVRVALNCRDERVAPGMATTGHLATFGDHPALPAISDMVQRHQIPPEYLFAVIDGVESDLVSLDISTFRELERYCYHVAGAVGLCCIHVWGFHGDEAIPLAIDCGLAFQLTNILRDIKEDAEVGRIYLPREDLDRFSYSEESLRSHEINEPFMELMSFETARAQVHYEKAEMLFDYLEPHGQRILRAMIDIYRGLLHEIERRRFDVFSQRVSLPKWKKLWFAGRAILMSRSSRRTRTGHVAKGASGTR